MYSEHDCDLAVSQAEGCSLTVADWKVAFLTGVSSEKAHSCRYHN